jgi:regulator of sigma E protease
VWRRIAIVAAGPLANFLLAIMLFAGLFMHGVEEPARAARDGRRKHGGLAGRPARRRRPSPPSTANRSRPGRAALGAVRRPRSTSAKPARRRAATAAALHAPCCRRAPGELEPEATSWRAGPDDVAPAAGDRARCCRRPGRARRPAAGRPGDRDRRQAVIDGIAFVEAVRASGRAHLQLEVQRGGQPLTLEVTPEFEPAKTGQGLWDQASKMARARPRW